MAFSSLFKSFSGKELDASRSAKLDQKPSAAKIRLAEMITQQIQVEQSLASTRMTWNLTFQGFTIAGYALVATADASAPARWVVQCLIAAVSIIVALATLQGIKAAQQQRSYLKRVWGEQELSLCFPEPFSADSGSRWGRAPATWICLVLAGMWLVLIPASLVLTGDPKEPMEIRLVSESR
ncbi:MAG: hypothetical protein KDE15_00515 [Erythrobacter sp.]|nr:hypothetical protein [Erythrobacter sp.]